MGERKSRLAASRGAESVTERMSRMEATELIGEPGETMNRKGRPRPCDNGISNNHKFQ